MSGSKSEAALVACPEPAALTQSDTASIRSKVVGVRFTEAEYESLAAVAAERHLSIPEVLRLSWSLIERLETQPMIRKWDVPLGVLTTLPAGAEPLHVAIQNDQLRVWTTDNKGLALLGCPNTVKWFGTGHTPPADSRYVGTVHDRAGFVWHLFRLPWGGDEPTQGDTDA